MSEARKISIKILQEVLENKEFFAEIREKRQEQIQGVESFVSMLVLTTLRKKCFLEKTINKFTQKPIRHKDIFVKYAMLCASCEIFYMDSPAYAVLNDYVEIIKKENGKFSASFANAVLRKISAGKETLLQEDTLKDFPADFKNLLESDYGSKTASEIEKYFAKKPALDITLKKPLPDFSEKTGAVKLDETSYRFYEYGDIKNIYGFEHGLWWVQDYAASLPVKMLGNIQGKKVLDLCAAPGGKTAQLLSRGANVTAVDISPQRIARMKENMERLHFDNLNIVCDDALSFLQQTLEDFDIILLDAPCSATGTFRRHPEIPHIKQKEDVLKMAEIQEKFLSKAAEKIKKGGEIVYCVCSIFKSEGERIISDFLSRNSDFCACPIENFSVVDTRIITEENFIRTLPIYSDGMDAFFAVKLKKLS